MILQGKKVLLRAIEEDDLEMLRDLINDPIIEGLVCGFSFPVSKHQQKKWFEYISQDKDTARFTVETKDDGPVGYACISDINWKNRTCFPGLKLSNKVHQKKGIGYDSVMVLMRYVFEELNLNHIGGEIIDYNERSKKLLLGKLNWQQEGLKRKYIYNDGRYHDVIICSILKEEYYELLLKTKYWES